MEQLVQENGRSKQEGNIVQPTTKPELHKKITLVLNTNVTTASTEQVNENQEEPFKIRMSIQPPQPSMAVTQENNATSVSSLKKISDQRRESKPQEEMIVEMKTNAGVVASLGTVAKSSQTRPKRRRK